MRVGLVLGAGGVLGGAWLTGGLHALAEETGWDPGSADFIVGTSAGSMIGALGAAGVPPWFMVAHSAGETFDGLTAADGSPAAEADRAAGAVFRLHRGLPAARARARCAWRSRALRNPLGHTPLQMLAGWLPTRARLHRLAQGHVRRAVPGRWVDHPNFWAVACDYAQRPARAVRPRRRARTPRSPTPWRPRARSRASTGRSRSAAAATWTAASAPPRTSTCVAGRGLDLVICLNPLRPRSTTTHERPLAARPAGPARLAGALSRQANGRRLGHEAGKVRSCGTEVVLIQPTRRGPRGDGPQPDERRRGASR